MSFKESKLKETIKELAAEYFSRESNRTSLITITNVELMSRNTRATILFTVLPQTQEPAALGFMHRQLSDFREYVNEHARMMRVPYFDVAVDEGEKNRQKIEDISIRTGAGNL
jgi:ribosome-binding factor A